MRPSKAGGRSCAARIVGTCEWDNSAENQPWVDGVQLDPVDLTWGFDALAEMCNGGVSMTID